MRKPRKAAPGICRGVQAGCLPGLAGGAGAGMAGVLYAKRRIDRRGRRAPAPAGFGALFCIYLQQRNSFVSCIISQLRMLLFNKFNPLAKFRLPKWLLPAQPDYTGRNSNCEFPQDRKGRFPRRFSSATSAVRILSRAVLFRPWPSL